MVESLNSEDMKKFTKSKTKSKINNRNLTISGELKNKISKILEEKSDNFKEKFDRIYKLIIESPDMRGENIDNIVDTLLENKEFNDMFMNYCGMNDSNTPVDLKDSSISFFKGNNYKNKIIKYFIFFVISVMIQNSLQGTKIKNMFANIFNTINNNLLVKILPENLIENIQTKNKELYDGVKNLFNFAEIVKGYFKN